METCSRCNKSLKKGVTLRNLPQNCEDELSFPYMQLGESMHLECYVSYVIEKLVKEKLEIQ